MIFVASLIATKFHVKNFISTKPRLASAHSYELTDDLDLIVSAWHDQHVFITHKVKLEDKGSH